VSELVVDARTLVYRVAVGLGAIEEVSEFDRRLVEASALLAPSCEFLRAYRMLGVLAAEGFLAPSDATRLSMLVCESGVELRPLWPWDVPRIAALNCHPSDAWCIAIAESVGATFVTRNPALKNVGATCSIEVF
jgi:hypothetical protein